MPGARTETYGFNGARNGSASAVGSHEQGWKDTVYLPIREAATFIARFDETADSSFPFMYHCHMVNHEDGGLHGPVHG